MPTKTGVYASRGKDVDTQMLVDLRPQTGRHRCAGQDPDNAELRPAQVVERSRQ